MKVLQLCHRMPYPPGDGGAQLMYFTIRGLLQQGIELKTLSLNPSRNFVDGDVLPPEFVRETQFEYVPVDTKIDPLKMLLNTFKSESYFIERFVSEEFNDKLKQVLISANFDIIQLEHLYMCRYIETIRRHSDAKVVLRPQNAEYVIWERYIKGVKNPVKKLFLKTATRRLKKFEQQAANAVDLVQALTREDATEYTAMAPAVPVRIVPMGYDFTNLNNYNFERQYENVPVFYHLGSMNWLPNQEAITWFCEKVLAVLQSKGFDSDCILAGRHMPEHFYNYASGWLKVIGAIDDPLSFQEDKQVMLVPLWSGSGIRAKIVEGLALGKTIISTTIGAQGIAYTHDENILIADTPEAFAEQMMRCASDSDLCVRIGTHARKLGLEHYHFDATATAMKRNFQWLLDRGPRRSSGYEHAGKAATTVI